MAATDGSSERPGCVSLYAALTLLAGLGGVALVPLVLLPGPSGEGGSVPFVILTTACAGLLSALPIATAIGLWRMAGWGWWLAILTNALTIAVALLNVGFGLLAAGEGRALSGEMMAGSGLGLVVSGGILYWFAVNRRQFGVGIEGRSGLTGRLMALVVAMGAVICMAPVLIIAILTLLGPQLQDVYPRVIGGLSR